MELTPVATTHHTRRTTKTLTTDAIQHRDQVSLGENQENEERGVLKRLASFGKLFQSKGPAVKPANDHEGLKLAAPIAGFALACVAALISSRRND